MFSSFWMANPGGGGYSVDNSAVFNDDDTEYLTRTPGSAGNTKTWTVSFWRKLGKITTSSVKDTLFSARSANPYLLCQTNDNSPIGSLIFAQYNGSGYDFNLATDMIFRDSHAWYHIVIAVDTTQATDTNRVKMYVNGSQVTFGTASYPSQNLDTYWNTTYEQRLGMDFGSRPMDGYLSEFVCIDGSALDPTSFGEYDTNGVWRPVDVSGLTFGTNGFYLPFTDSTFLGVDGNGTETAVVSYQSSQWTGNATALNDALFGVFAANERGTFNKSQDDGFMDSMTNSFWYDEGAAGGTFYFGSTSEATGVAIAAGSVVTITRSGSTISITDDASTVHTFTGTYNGTMYFLGGCRNTGSQSLNFDSISFDKVNQFGNNGFYLPFTDSTFLGVDGNGTETAVVSYQSSQWTGNTGSYSYTQQRQMTP
jgi:hypothetical protein